MSGDLHVVHVRVVDGATGQPTPVRMRFQGKDGRIFAPLGRLNEFPTGVGEQVGLQVKLGNGTFHYVDGACEILLPADPFDIEIHKGPEYEPIRRTVTLGPGKMALRFVIERRSDLRRTGWFAGDCRAHELSPHAALVEGAAEGLAVVNLLARQRPSQFGTGLQHQPQLEAFSGQSACLATAECSVHVSTFNEHPVLGKLALLNCHRPVFPLQAGEEGFEDWTLADWCGQCHRKKGLVLWSEPVFWSSALEECPAAEGLALLITGGVDAIEIAGPISRLGSDPWTNWYALLNAGFKVPIAGSSGKVSNTEQLGTCRTFAYIGPEVPFSYGYWIEAIRAGKTIVTDGPFIDLAVEGHVAGDLIAAESQKSHLKVAVALPFASQEGKLELVGNGEVLTSTRISDGDSGTLTVEIPRTEFHWLAARYRTPKEEFIAHTSPVYVANALRPKSTAEPSRVLEAALLRGAQWASRAEFRSERNRTGLVSLFQVALERLGSNQSPV